MQVLLAPGQTHEFSDPYVVAAGDVVTLGLYTQDGAEIPSGVVMRIYAQTPGNRTMFAILTSGVHVEKRTKQIVGPCTIEVERLARYPVDVGVFVDDGEPATNGLATSLTNFWPLDEATGTRSNTERNLHLTESGAIGSTTGLRGGDTLAVHYVDTNTLTTGNTDTVYTGEPFSFSYWIKTITPADGEITLPMVWMNAVDNGDYYSDFVSKQGPPDADFFEVSINNDFASGPYINHPEAGDLDFGTWSGVWHHIAWGADGDEIWLQVDNGPRRTTPNTAGLHTSATHLMVTNTVYGAQGDYAVQFLAHWNNRTLTEDDVALLYNGGEGLTRSEMT